MLFEIKKIPSLIKNTFHKYSEYVFKVFEYEYQKLLIFNKYFIPLIFVRSINYR